MITRRFSDGCRQQEDQSFVQTLRRHAVLFSALAFSGKAGRATAKTTGKIALITGASTGIGKATAAELARSGQYAYIFLAGHNEAKTRKALEDLKGGPAKLEYLPLELASLQSVRQAAKSFQDMDLPLHTLICNAAVMALPERQVTKDGYEFQFEVNYLSHFLLVNLLLPQLTAAGSREDPARTEAFQRGHLLKHHEASQVESQQVSSQCNVESPMLNHPQKHQKLATWYPPSRWFMMPLPDPPGSSMSPLLRTLFAVHWPLATPVVSIWKLMRGSMPTTPGQHMDNPSWHRPWGDRWEHAKALYKKISLQYDCCIERYQFGSLNDLKFALGSDLWWQPLDLPSAAKRPKCF